MQAKRTALLAFLIVGACGASAAFAQATSYTSVVAMGSKPVQLTYHASAHKDCAPAAPPQVKAIESPKNGTLTVRTAVLTTERFRNCGKIKVPAEVVFYQAKEGYVGPDHVRYRVIGSNGEATTYDVAIAVRAEQPSAVPEKRLGTQL